MIYQKCLNGLRKILKNIFRLKIRMKCGKQVVKDIITLKVDETTDKSNQEQLTVVIHGLVISLKFQNNF